MKTIQFRNIKKQQGVTLIELLLGLGIIVVILGVGIIIYNQTQQGSRAYTAETGVLSLVAAVKTVNPNPSYAGLSQSTIINAGKAPSNMVSGTALINPWGGSVTIAPATYNGTANAAFLMTYNDVPRSECNSLVNGVAQNFQVIAVGSTTVKDVLAGTNPTATTVSNACNNDTNDIGFTSAG